MFYVMGFDELNRVIIMRQRPFDCVVEAQAYADSCSKLWRTFIVRDINV